jgi:hypothetical protein
MSTPYRAFEKEREEDRKRRDAETIRQLQHEKRLLEHENGHLRELNRLLGQKILELKREAREVQ